MKTVQIQWGLYVFAAALLLSLLIGILTLRRGRA
jgi:hypothetical protein